MSKKGGKVQKEPSTYDVRDIVLAKVRGFPPWPGMIVDPESVPPGVIKERPQGKKSSFYCIRFFPAGDYAWLVPKDISKLQRHEIEAYINEPYKRSGDLLTGYRVALDPTKWEEEIQAAGLQAAEEEANAEVDELEESENEDDDDEKKPVKTKKRKRDSEAGAASSKAKAKPKVKKESTEEPAGKKKGNGGGKVRKNSKSKTMVESEDEGDQAEPGDDEGAMRKKASPPPQKKAKREKDQDEELDPAIAKDPEAIKVRDWRHKLQKVLLNNKSTVPKDDEMPAVDQLFTTVENYDKINIQYLSFSKIGKVMRHIAVLPSERVPRDEEFKFRERAQALVDKWHQILSVNKFNGNGSEAGANGTAKSPSHPPELAGDTPVGANGDAKKTVDMETAPVLDGKAEPEESGKTEERTEDTTTAATQDSGPAQADVVMAEA